MRELGKRLKDDLSRYEHNLGCKNQYRTTMRNKAALIVVTHCWEMLVLRLPFCVDLHVG